jgi:hypothetical protein
MDSYVDRTGSVLDGDHWTHCFSQTFLNGYTTCPERARATYFREVPSPPTDASARGTAVHAGCEFLLHEKMIDHDGSPHGGCGPYSLEGAIECARAELDRIGEWRYTKYSRQRVYDDQALLLRGFYHEILPHVEPHAVEKSFDVTLLKDEHREIRLLGTMDCEDEAGEGWDWKSTREPYVPWEKQRYAVQPTVYSYALHQLQTPEIFSAEPMPEALFHYGVMFPDGSTQILSVKRDESNIEWLRKQCLQIAMMIERGVTPWPMNDTHVLCSPRWCDNWANCKGAVMLPGWDKAPK